MTEQGLDISGLNIFAFMLTQKSNVVRNHVLGFNAKSVFNLQIDETKYMT